MKGYPDAMDVLAEEKERWIKREILATEAAADGVPNAEHARQIAQRVHELFHNCLWDIRDKRKMLARKRLANFNK